jgi:hypothetical protein
VKLHMVLLGQHSDRTMERKGHVAVALLMAAIGIGMSGLVSNPIIVMALLCFAQIGVSSVPAMFCRRKYFDSIPHSQLRDFLDQRVTDGVIRRMPS